MGTSMLNLGIPPQTVAIIGSGFSGTLVAANLLRNTTIPLKIKLIERSSQFGRGVAYGTQIESHLLNVPAGKMSAFPDEPSHFLNWLHKNGYEEVTASTFVSRRIYGDYVQAILKEAEESKPAYVRFEKIVDEAIGIESASENTTIYLSGGECFSAQKVVLALGNFSASLPQPLASLPNRDRYITDAWSQDAIAQIKSDDSILLVGTGLTMVDIFVALQRQGFSGKIHAVSRHGLTPIRHEKIQGKSSIYPAFINLETAPKTARKLLRLVRQEIQIATEQGQNWRSVIDAIRPVTQSLWRSLPSPEKNRFLRHVKAYWEVHRHRIAPEIADILDTVAEAGQLNYYGGRIASCQEVENGVNVTIRQRKTGENLVLSVDKIINCTGANTNFRRLQHPLLASLQEQRLIRTNTLSMGIDTATNGALIDADGKVSDQLYTLGTPRKGDLWETTAVPEIRVQAANLAKEILTSSSNKFYAAIEEIWFKEKLTSESNPSKMIFRQLFDRESCTYTYLIIDGETHTALLVDPVLEQVERDLQILRELGLTLRYCLETHIHADHITGTDALREITGCAAILPENSQAIGANRYIRDGEILKLGSVEIQAIAAPGHTNSHMVYLMNGSHLLTGDALFIRGCGRTDFQNGDAGALYDTVTQKLFKLPDDTLVYPGHDYQGRTVSTIGEEKQWNSRFSGRSRKEFIELMNHLKLPYPKKMSEAVPANQNCGKVVNVWDFQI
ncbi:FAD/NAD(P)-binding protein [Calothrix sp. 336/3]|uniref:FAD/NAD(P)-binding protein n=1 Tax=Calothrix sp. 336/3 TaxID=1337936 RepID=UPI0006247648|nr:FAD/NAD(P)-binding protein [Calothrix sp. 336/3]AKG21372.1 hydroxyacylglutathione hydrolase [Calothrix sp. 336/3]